MAVELAVAGEGEVEAEELGTTEATSGSSSLDTYYIK